MVGSAHLVLAYIAWKLLILLQFLSYSKKTVIFCTFFAFFEKTKNYFEGYQTRCSNDIAKIASTTCTQYLQLCLNLISPFQQSSVKSSGLPNVQNLPLKTRVFSHGQLSTRRAMLHHGAIQLGYPTLYLAYIAWKLLILLPVVHSYIPQVHFWGSSQRAVREPYEGTGKQKQTNQRSHLLSASTYIMELNLVQFSIGYKPYLHASQSYLIAPD